MDHEKTLHLIVISPRPVTSPTLPGRDSQCPSPLQSFPNTKSIAGCSFLLGSLNTTAQMLSAADVPSHQLELLFVCVGGDVYRGFKILIDPRWKGSSLPFPFYVSATYFWFASNRNKQSPIPAGWECWWIGWSRLFVSGY